MTDSPEWVSRLRDGLAGYRPPIPNAPWVPYSEDAGLLTAWLAYREGADRPTYRTEPIPGAELGGHPHNPEAAVIDEIDRIVDWQLEGRDGW